jgi:TonB family protein
MDDSQAIEVVAEFDGAIIEVNHVVRDDGAEAAGRHTRWLLGGGMAAFAVAAAAFGCAYAGVAVGRAVDVLVAVCLGGGTWALMRAAERASWQQVWRGRFAPADAYTVGPDPRASFALDAASVPAARFSLVRVDEAGEFVLALADGMSGALTLDGARRPLGAGAHALVPGARAWVKTGAVTFFVAHVPAPCRQPLARGFDWRHELYLGGVALAVAAFLFLVYAVPPQPKSLALDLVGGRRFARFVIVAPAPPPPPLTGPAADAAAPGRATRQRAGTLGTATARARTGAVRLPGPVSRERVIAAAEARAQSSAILGVLRAAEGSHVGSIFGAGNPLGDNAPAILEGLQSAELRDGYGSGADEIGHDPGGGGDADQTIGAGPLGTVGFCRGPSCRDRAHAYLRSAPTGALSHRAHAPDLVPGIATVKCGVDASCLDKEIVRRVVREHRNEVRHCYERALVARPELQGRVVTRFTIATTGRVLGAAVTESSLSDRDVEQCIAEAVRRWEFPSSQQSASVSYPFLLMPPR